MYNALKCALSSARGKRSARSSQQDGTPLDSEFKEGTPLEGTTPGDYEDYNKSKEVPPQEEPRMKRHRSTSPSSSAIFSYYRDDSTDGGYGIPSDLKPRRSLPATPGRSLRVTSRMQARMKAEGEEGAWNRDEATGKWGFAHAVPSMYGGVEIIQLDHPDYEEVMDNRSKQLRAMGAHLPRGPIDLRAKAVLRRQIDTAKTTSYHPRDYKPTDKALLEGASVKASSYDRTAAATYDRVADSKMDAMLRNGQDMKAGLRVPGTNRRTQQDFREVGITKETVEDAERRNVARKAAPLWNANDGGNFESSPVVKASGLPQQEQRGEVRKLDMEQSMPHTSGYTPQQRDVNRLDIQQSMPKSTPSDYRSQQRDVNRLDMQQAMPQANSSQPTRAQWEVHQLDVQGPGAGAAPVAPGFWRPGRE
ncbi:unnamed protein product [Amoebophrya sp. A25]|nr:unnamed protein product [Amoebophrya sp. A25]|eukprot:GSA25T00006149001.1